MKEKSNFERLNLLKLPLFSNKEELSSLIHIDTNILMVYCNHNSKFYKKYTIPKSNGSPRQIMQPCRELKGIQAWILRNILDKLPTSDYATAYIKNKSIKDNAEPHKNNRYFIFLDLEDFFPSITEGRVYKIFRSLGYTGSVSRILTRFCTCDGQLPQGAVTSPSLSNIVASRLDKRLAGYCSRRNVTYTRYADDITVSSNNNESLGKNLPVMLHIIKSEKFNLNSEKTRMLGPSKKCEITGLIKNSSESKIGIGRKKKRHIRAVMHHLRFDLEKDKKYKSSESVSGWMSYLKSVDEASYQQMLKYQVSLDEKVKKHSK